MHVTKRERDILQLICKSNPEISEILGIRLTTVKAIMHNMLERFDVQSRTGLILKALKNKLIALEDIAE